MATTAQLSTTSLTTVIILCSFIILAIGVGLLAWSYPLAVPLPRQPVGTVEINQNNNRRPPVAYPDEIPPICGFRNVLGRRSLVGSNEIIESIRISPSNPAIFGDDKSPELSMRIFLTPPTPSREEGRRRSS